MSYGFNAFVRGWDPTAIRDMMLNGLNTPIRIGRVTVLPFARFCVDLEMP